jgi:hypothetical protein
MVFPGGFRRSPRGASGLSQNTKSAFQPEGKMNGLRFRIATDDQIEKSQLFGCLATAIPNRTEPLFIPGGVAAVHAASPSIAA